MKKLEAVTLGTCRGCGLRIVINEQARTAEHEAPVCQAFRDAATACGATEESEPRTTIVHETIDDEDTEPDFENTIN